MLSIITAIHNQLPMNQLFLKHLRAATHYPFELIIVDNGSTDGSADFFEREGVVVIKNGVNYYYPRSQNIGIAKAKNDWLAFLNNDIIVSPGWDRTLIDSMNVNQLDVATSCGVERIENFAATRSLKRRWKLIRNVIGLFGYGQLQLSMMHRLMYPSWNAFCARRQTQFKGQVLQGFVGNTVMMHRRTIDKIGLWDERIQGADFDLYLRTIEYGENHGDMRPVHIALDCYNHHFIRLTAKGSYPPFHDRDQLIPLEEKWSSEKLQHLKRM